MLKINKIILAYSGDLETSVILKWLKLTYDSEIITVTADIGQHEDLAIIEKKALGYGATKAFILDLREDLARHYIFPMMRAAARYENRYLLGTSIATPCIARALVEVAKAEGAQAIAHGSTGKGNDQVRFEFAIRALAPELQVIAPWREWELADAAQLHSFAEQHGIEIPATSIRYRMNTNMFNTSFEGGELDDPGNPPPNDCRNRSVPPEEAPDTPEFIEIGFVRGNPVSINGEQLSPSEIISTLCEIAGRNGIGRVDMVENRFVGLKGRGIYDNPAGTLLYELHRDLEGICMDGELMAIRDILAVPYAHAVYNGFWFSPEREAMQAFFDKSQESVTGIAKAKLYKGGIWPTARTSPYSLFPEGTTQLDCGDYDSNDAAGFIRMNGLRLGLYSAIKSRLGEWK